MNLNRMAMQMRIKTLTVIILAALSVVFGGHAHALEKSMSFDKTIISSEYVVVGSIENLASDVSKIGNIFTVAEIGNVSVLTANGEIPINGSLPIYFIGGVIPNPDYKAGDGSFKYKLSYMSGTPYMNTGDKLILFISGNGDAYLPFVGNESGVLRVAEEGHVTLNDGRAVTSLGSDLKVESARRSEFVKLINSSSKVEDFIPEQLDPSGSRVSVSSLIDYVARVRKNSGIEESLGINDLVNVIPTVEYFQK